MILYVVSVDSFTKIENPNSIELEDFTILLYNLNSHVL